MGDLQRRARSVAGRALRRLSGAATPSARQTGADPTALVDVAAPQFPLTQIPGTVSLLIIVEGVAQLPDDKTLSPLRSIFSEVVVAIWGSTGADPELSPEMILLPDRFVNWTSALNAALTASSGELRAVWSGARVASDTWAGLVNTLASCSPETAAVQAVVVDDYSGTIAAAGAIRISPTGVLVPLLAGHPCEDLAAAASLASDVLVSEAFVFAARAVRDTPPTRDVDVHSGADRVLGQSALWGARWLGGQISTVLSARVYLSVSLPVLSCTEPNGDIEAAHHALGFHVDGWRAAAAEPPTLVRPVTAALRRRNPDQLRWSVKIAAHAGPRGDVWGDTFFAEDLAASLRKLGQEVVVDRLEAGSRPLSDYLDDVSVTIRGLHRVPLNPGAINLLWIISHPDVIGPHELSQGYDQIFAASEPWSTWATAHYGISVTPLLQATSERFVSAHTGAAATGALFVGKSRNVFRPIVRDCLELGEELAIYGEGWQQFLGESHPAIRAEFLSNESLPAAYASAGTVLNDHWDDMRAHGFMSNRLFDAVAAGAFVVTDDIPGIDLFGGSVASYSTPAQLQRLLHNVSARPDDSARRANAAHIRDHHTFDQRAAVLLEAAHRARRARRMQQ